MNERKRRIGENEAIFRSVNEQVRELTETLATATGTMKVVGECGARSCTDQFEITTDAYAQVRADSTLFVVKPGHDLPETETVVDKNDIFWTVPKRSGGSPPRSHAQQTGRPSALPRTGTKAAQAASHTHATTLAVRSGHSSPW